MGADDTTEYRLRALNTSLAEQERRITRLEEFTLMAKGALAIIGFIVGSGFGTAVILFALGVI